MDVVLKPLRVATSKPAQQTYLNTILFFATSTVLFGLAVIAYVLFYFSYIPQVGVERVIHLQFGDTPNPYGITSLSNALVSRQPYDIMLSLSLPRSPPNLNAGNFMLSLSLISPLYQLPSNPPTLPLSTAINPSSILFTSRRPATLTYTSRLISLASRLLTLPFYILGLKHESENLVVPMAESLVFPKGWKNIPSHAMLELQSAGETLHVYDAKVHFKAIFGGMRWLMYNHRIISFLGFVSLFWCAEVVFMILGWVVLRWVFGGREEGRLEEEGFMGEKGGRIKEDEEEVDLSDASRTFPTYGKQPPLKYESQIKDERAEEDLVIDQTAIQPLGAGEADDEDEDGVDIDERGRRSDSGLGTSFSEGGDRTGLARRRSKGLGGKD